MEQASVLRKRTTVNATLVMGKFEVSNVFVHNELHKSS